MEEKDRSEVVLDKESFEQLETKKKVAQKKFREPRILMQLMKIYLEMTIHQSIRKKDPKRNGINQFLICLTN